MKIEVKNLNKSFNKIEVLKDINITFESGKIYGLIGRNGSGKSVFLKLLCGFYKPTSGKILYDGIDRITKENLSMHGSVISFENLVVNELFLDSSISDDEVSIEGPIKRLK